MVKAVENIVLSVSSFSDAGIDSKNISILLDNERTFLQSMDTIVNEYDMRSKEQLQNLQHKEYLLLAFALMILILEILFIFRPLSIQIRKTITNLILSQLKSDTNAKDLQKLFLNRKRPIRKILLNKKYHENAYSIASCLRL